MHSVDTQSDQLRRGRRQREFLSERYWDRYSFVRAPFDFDFHRCRDRNDFIRKKHTPDKDGRCVFCSYLDPRLGGLSR